MAEQSKTPTRDVIRIAIEGSDVYPGDMLEEVLRYAFDQLCWKRTTPELHALLGELNALIAEETSEDAASMQTLHPIFAGIFNSHRGAI